MTYVLKLHGVIVGRSDLEDRDPSTRIASGAFRKGAGYELVEPIFDLRRKPGDQGRYRQARDKLDLELFDADGRLIDTAAVDVEPGETAESLRLRVAIPDPAFWQ